MNHFTMNLQDGAALSEMVERLGWVLIHSVWQFSLVAISFMVAERLLAKRSAAVRYFISAIAMCAMVCIAAATFFLMDSHKTVQVVAASTNVDRSEIDAQLRWFWISEDASSRPYRVSHVMQDQVQTHNRPAQTTPPADTSANSAVSAKVSNLTEEQPITTKVRIMNTLRPWLGTCVLLWLIGMAIAALRLVAGGLQVWRLRRFGTSPVSDDILRLLTSTARRLGLRRSVKILQSSLVTGPVVIGWLRPLILLPVSSITGLTTEQFEAVLAHELAHIRRFDYIVNLLQIIVETVFFYHPAIWWVSRRMRMHREDCCDDQAVSVVSSPLTYASALLALYDLREGRESMPVPVAALSATGGSLKKRIHRILRADHTLQSATGWWISTGVVAVFVLIVGCGLMSQHGLTDDKTPEQKQAANDDKSDQSPLIPVPDPLNAGGKLQLVPLPPAQTTDERERVLKQLESQGVSRLDALDITPNQPPGAEAFAAHLWDVPEAAWPLLGQLDSIRRLDLTASRVSPEAFRHVAGMKSLTHVTVRNSRFEPQHLEALDSLKQLQSIDVMLTVFDQTSDERRALLGKLSPAEQQRFDAIAGAHQNYNHIAEAAILTDRAMQQLSGLKELRTLRLVNTSVSNSGVLALHDMQNLTEVELSVGGTISREAADVLGSLQHLQKLTLLSRIDASVAEGLKGASALDELELRSIDNDVATVLAEIPSLQRLRLWANSLDDDGLLQLAKLEHLRQIDIRFAWNGKFTLSGIEQFQTARPGCVVQHDLRVETLSERKIPLPSDLFVVRLYWRKATSREQLIEHVQSRFSDSEHLVEFRPLTQQGYIGGIALVRAEAGRDWLLAQIGADGSYDVAYAEPLTYKRLKDEGVLFDALLKPEAIAATAKIDSQNPAPAERHAAGDVSGIHIMLSGESLPPFQELLARLREHGQGNTADGLQSLFNSEQKQLVQYPRAVIVYGQVVAKSGDAPRLCNAPMRIFEDGWFVAGLKDKDRPVGFRMFGCRPVDVVTSQHIPGVRPGATVSLGRIVMEPYAPTELATLRGRLRFAGETPPNGVRARIVISGGPTNSLTGGTDGFLEWPEKENVTLTDDLQLEHRQLAPLPHTLHIEAPGYEAVRRELDLTAGATLDLSVIDVPIATKFHVEFLASDSSNFDDAKLRATDVQLGEVWKSNPDNEALAKYPGGDMRFVRYPVDRKDPEGPKKLIIHSGISSLKLMDLGEGDLVSFRVSPEATPALRYSNDVTIESGHVYLCYHTHWKHWTLLRVAYTQ